MDPKSYSVVFLVLSSVLAVCFIIVPFLSPYAPRAFSKRPFIIRGKLENDPEPDDIMNTERRMG